MRPGSEIKPLRSVGALMTLIDFNLSNARRFYSSMGNPSNIKGLGKEINNQNNVVVLLQAIVNYFPLRVQTVYI